MDKAREEKVKNLRIIEIDKMIRSGNYPNVPEMQKRFEVSRATIMRDIEFLRDRYNAPLEYDYEKRGYYYTDSTFFVQSVMLSEAELFSVSVIQPLLSQYRNTPLESSIKNIFSKMAEMLPQDVSVNTAFLENDISFISDPLPKIDEDTFTKVFSSMRKHLSINFMYRSISQTDYSQHKSNVFHVLCQKGNWYMLAYDYKYKKITTFALARIKDIELTQESFSVPKNFKPTDYFDPNFGVWNTDIEPVKIELLFSKEINTYISERIWHETQELRINEDGTVYLSFLSNQIPETLHWVMNFGSKVQVLAPPKLIELVKSEVNEIIKMY
mgnify:CR=1 FL=1